VLGGGKLTREWAATIESKLAAVRYAICPEDID
jgi:hypothetical protein